MLVVVYFVQKSHPLHYAHSLTFPAGESVTIMAWVFMAFRLQLYLVRTTQFTLLFYRFGYSFDPLRFRRLLWKLVLSRLKELTCKWWNFNSLDSNSRAALPPRLQVRAANAARWWRLCHLYWSFHLWFGIPSCALVVYVQCIFGI